MSRTRTRIGRAIIVAAVAAAGMTSARAQAPMTRMPAGYIGEQVPEDIVRMYERGQDWLVRAQAANGRWSNEDGEDGPAIQGLSLLALIAEGTDPRYGRHAAAIRRGLDALLGMQDAQGYFGPSMYHHGFATLALAELYGMVDEPRLGPALVRAVRLILEAQKHSRPGAWRYSPGSSDADTTVSGAQVVALFAARNAGLEVPDEAIERALAFYRECQNPDGGIGYTERGEGSPPRNAIAVVVATLARERNSRLFRDAWAWLKRSGDNAQDSYYFYYLYYAAQAYFRADMNAWRTWNRQLADRLSATQNASGGWDGPNGSTFCTATSLLSMALNYRYLPIYER
ncbi:MAG: terpene cyclase/mutase family protein [Kiritimatiellae bacterium]|nr:terpene cyclase/mutase family protein [Kiritimatiellia bacterium]